MYAFISKVNQNMVHVNDAEILYGMGLFMVKTQVEAIGGKITVKSELNVGTEFTIEFKQ
ncbi:MAG: hypothetical protein ACEQSR_03925 [Candidatus Methylacidiphilales bacterium]